MNTSFAVSYTAARTLTAGPADTAPPGPGEVEIGPALTESVDALLREVTIVEKSKEWAKA